MRAYSLLQQMAGEKCGLAASLTRIEGNRFLPTIDSVAGFISAREKAI